MGGTVLHNGISVTAACGKAKCHLTGLLYCVTGMFTGCQYVCISPDMLLW
jgi:hypothetical protein